MTDEFDEFEYICPKCEKQGFMVSIETVVMRFPINFNEDGEVEYDGSNGKTLDSEVDCHMCSNCNTYYGTDELEEIAKKQLIALGKWE